MALNPFGLPVDGDTRSGSQAPTTAGIVERFGVLQPQEVILGLSGEYIGTDERAWSGGLVQVLGDLGFSSAASRVALNRVIARGLLEPEKEGRFVFYKITPRMRVVHDEGRRQTFSATTDTPWTGRWTVVMYAVTDDERVQRSRLGRWLSLLGFGSLQDGVWVAPGDSEADVVALARRLNLEKQVIIFVGELGATIDPRETATRAWKLDELKVMYDIFIKEFGALARQSSSDFEPREAFVKRTRLIEMFRQTATHDPRIPDELIQMNWKRREAIELFQTLQRMLSAGATAYFRGLVITGESAA